MYRLTLHGIKIGEPMTREEAEKKLERLKWVVNGLEMGRSE